MNIIGKVRQRLGLSQAELGERIGVTQGCVSHYEVGRIRMSPAVATRLVRFAKRRGVSVSLDDIYRK